MGKSHFITDDHDKLYRDTVRKIREDIGRKVKVHIPGPRVKCPNCIWNSTDHKSSGAYGPTSPYPSDIPGPTPFSNGPCPVCRGSGQYTRTIIKEILCHVRWRIPGENEKTSIGELEGFECRLQADIKHMPDFRNSVKIEVDTFPMELGKLYPRGLKKLIQVLVFLKRSDFNTPGNRTRTTQGVPL